MLFLNSKPSDPGVEVKKPDITVYTCIVGDYDYLLTPKVIPDGVRFYCFTDKPRRKVAGWQMLPLVQPSSVTDPVLINRYHKFFPYKVLPSVDYSLYVDGSIHIVGDVTTWVKKFTSKEIGMVCLQHPVRRTVFDEVERCEEAGLFSQEDVRLAQQQLADYCEEGMPAMQRLSENTVLLRAHDHPDLETAMELWWQQLNIYTKRDQLSLPYVIWKTGFVTDMVNVVNLRTPNPYFVWNAHRRNGLKGVWQGIYLRRNHEWWCGLLVKIRQLLLPPQVGKKTIRRTR